MLRTNLSTRPFYNERVVHLVLAVVGVLALGILTAGVVRILELARSNTELTAAAEQSERTTAGISTQASALRRETSNAELEALATAAQEANRLIDRRVFSWTEFFNRIERTLPGNVMLTAVRPDIDADLISVLVGVIGREVDDIDRFIEELEATGAFAEILAREEEIIDGGMYRAQLVGRYLPGEAVPGAGETSPQP